MERGLQWMGTKSFFSAATSCQPLHLYLAFLHSKRFVPNTQQIGSHTPSTDTRFTSTRDSSERKLASAKIRVSSRKKAIPFTGFLSAKWFIWLILVLVMVRHGHAYSCQQGEFRCNDGSCISADKYCDGSFDCPRKDDEPRLCTPCGRIYYGMVRKTYQLEVNRPIKSRGPDVCNLTFVATGDNMGGNIVQISILKFSLGKFHSHTSKGCPHGHMQIIEDQRMHRNGYWCGNGVGMEIYYSETPSVTVALTMLPPDNDLTSLDSYPSFYFLMTYKFLMQSDALVRYGPPVSRKYAGIRDQTTVCNVHFHNCDPNPCYVQSPNFPGMYPRNTTCYYHLKQTDTVPGTRAVLSLEQKKAHLIHIKSVIQAHDTKERRLKLYEDCYYVGDYVRVYDGNSTTSPVLITFCRGDSLPEIVSSGPYMLIEFTTSAFDVPDREVPWTHVNGFEIVVRPKYISVGEIGPDCSQKINGKDHTRGWISNPVFSLTPNTTCIWEFQGLPHHVLWFTFAHYWIEKQEKLLHMKACAAELTIYDSNYGTEGVRLGSYCHHKLPVVCERAHRLRDGKPVRPCNRNESYVTSSSKAAISQLYGESTVVKNVRFLLRYEFVDTRLHGVALGGICDRILRSDGKGEINTLNSPKYVFLYGRGGRSDVDCSWVLKGNSDEIVQVNLTAIKSTNSRCSVITHQYTKASDCQSHGHPYMSVRFSEWPWKGIEIPKKCACSSDSVPLYLASLGPVVAINWTIRGMQSDQDFNDFSFHVSYKFVKKAPCKHTDRRIDEPAGELTFKEEDEEECSRRPWLLTAPSGHSMLLTINRAVLANESCVSDSRLLLRLPGEKSVALALCPSADPTSIIKLLWPPQNRIRSDYSPNDPSQNLYWDKFPDGTASLIVQWESRSMSTLTMTWLRIWTPINATMSHLPVNGEAYPNSKTLKQSYCREWCPELSACIPNKLWCDGHPHCPNGSDETVANCLLERIPWHYFLITVITLGILLMITVSALKRNRVDNGKKRKKCTRRASTQESFLPSKDNHRLSAYTPDFTDMDFETTV